MKIAFILLNSFESMITVMREYSRVLCERGHNVTIFAKGELPQKHDDDKAILIKVCREYLNSKITHLIFIIKLIFILRHQQYDVAHVYNSAGMSLLPICCKKSAARWILDIRTVRIDGGIIGFIFDKLKLFEAFFFDIVIVLSKGLKNKLFGKRLTGSAFIIPLGANLERFAQTGRNRKVWEGLQIKDSDMVLTYIGAIDKTRKIENMLKAFRIALDEINAKNIKLIIIGGPEYRIEELKREAERLAIRADLFFLGQVPYNRIPEYLAGSDIGLCYIPKSKVYDAQPPLKTLEYMAASLPVVATDTTANSELIKDGVNGILTTDDSRNFAKGILRLLLNPQLTETVKANASKSIIQYDWDNIVNKLLDVYKERG